MKSIYIKKLLLILFIVSFCFEFSCDRNNSIRKSSNTNISAEILRVEVSRESIMYARAIISIFNPTSRQIRIMRYKIFWDGGSFIGTGLRNKRIDPGKSRSYSIRIDPIYGDINMLLENPHKARVSILDYR